MTEPVIDDEKWEAIARELPDRARHSRQFRALLAAYIGEYAKRGYPDRYLTEREALRAKNQEIAEAARILLDKYDFGMAARDGWTAANLIAEHESYEAFRAQLGAVAENAESNLRKLGRRVRVSTRPRDIFLGMVVKLWEDNGGKLTTTVRHVDTDMSEGKIAKSDGRLVQYLVAVAQAAEFQLTPDQAREFVRKIRKKGKPSP